MPNGLGGITPTQKRIQALGTRQTASPVAADRTAAPATQTPATAQARVGGEQRQSLFQENPLMAIGLVLSNIAAGFEGRTLPTVEFERQRLEQEKLRQSQALLGIEALKTFVDLAPDLNDEGRAALAEKLTEATGGAFDFKNLSLQPTVVLEDVLQVFTGGAPEFLEPAVRAAGGPAEYFKNKDLQEMVETQTDQKYRPTALKKVQAAIQAVVGDLTPEEQRLTQGQNFSFNFIREKAQEIGLNQFELASLEANESSLIPIFAQVGVTYVPEETAAAVQEARLKKGPSEFERKVNFIADLTDKERDVVAERLAFGDDDKSTDNFFRALDELEELRQQGKTPANDERAANVQKRLDQLTSEKGFFMSFNEKGEIEFIGQGDVGGLAAGMTAAQAFKQGERIQALNSTIDMFDTVILAIDDNPTAFGIIGDVRRGFQAAVGVTRDLGTLIEAGSGGTIDINAAAANARSLVIGTPIEGAFEGVFDPQLSKTKLLEHTLAFELARLRLTRSGGDIRALTQVFKDAKQDVNLTGLTFSRDVRERMTSIRDQFVRELREITKLFAGSEAQRKPSEERKTDLERQVDEILFR